MSTVKRFLTLFRKKRAKNRARLKDTAKTEHA
jgi:hypothetical protein